MLILEHYDDGELIELLQVELLDRWFDEANNVVWLKLEDLRDATVFCISANDKDYRFNFAAKTLFNHHGQERLIRCE